LLPKLFSIKNEKGEDEIGGDGRGKEEKREEALKEVCL